MRGAGSLVTRVKEREKGTKRGVGSAKTILSHTTTHFLQSVQYESGSSASRLLPCPPPPPPPAAAAASGSLTSTASPPPPPPEDPPPPPEHEEEEPPPELDSSPPPISLEQLDMALEPGTGGALSGDFALPSFDAKKTNLGMDIFDINDLEKKPQPRRQLPPRYPAKAKANGIEGFVLAEFIVDQNGEVESVVVKDSSHSFFEAPTVDAIRNWVFTPGEKDGRKVRTRVRVKIPYTLQ